MLIQNGYQKENGIKILQVNGSAKLAKDTEKTIDSIASQQSSEYVRSLIEANRDLLVATNLEGKITDMNESLVKITGITRKELLGTYFYNYFTEPQKAYKIYQDIFVKDITVDFPLTIRHKNGKLTEVLFSGLVYKDDKGNISGVIVSAKDITVQKRLETELSEAKRNEAIAVQKAGEAAKLKEAFLANMSHEIRTPLNAIIGFSDILSRKKLGKKQKDHVKTIKSAGENLLLTINDILDISKLEAGMMTFEEKNFNIRDILKSANLMLVRKAKEKDLELVFTCDEDVPDVFGDPGRLTQILINLTGNAIKFTPAGKVQVNVKVLKNEKENTFLEFSIKDTGIGIPEDKLHFVFERFRQAESHMTRKYGGSWLGLSIAKQLVELQGGTLFVKSKLKIGSVFSFCIPYKKSIIVQPVPEAIEKKYNIKDLRKLKILLVEDNRMNVLLVSSLFSENKLKLEVAENGSVCIDKLKKNKFDIILMDMEMPVMNGYESATIIRNELKNNIPIIAMTAHAMAGEREKCLSLGMNEYISKPINANLLFEKMYDLTLNS